LAPAFGYDDDSMVRSNNDSVLLSARGISKQFPGVLALDGVDFTLRAGEIHALMGENGAGKSTLIKVLTGLYPRDSGDVLLEGKPINPRTPLQAQAEGISTVYQEVNLVPELSVAENLYLGRQPRLGGMIRWGSVYKAAREAIRRLDLDIDVKRILSSYPVAIQQMVAIARAVDVQAKVLVLDEPTSSLDAKEVQSLFTVMRRLRDQGLGIVFVTHFMDQVYAVSDRITVLRNGKLVGEYATAELPRLQLIGAMIGRDASTITGHHPPPENKAAVKHTFLTGDGIGRQGAIEPFDITIHQGEIVGLAGLLGSGRTEIARLLFGVDHIQSGEITIEGKPAHLRNPSNAITSGIGFCGEDRKIDGIIPELSVRENIILALQARRGWLRKISRAKQQEIADHYIKALNIKTPDSEKSIRLLSGGNQQKALLARWLVTEPKLLILDEPTRGIDVGAKFEIARLIESLCEKGMALLFISSELEEVVRSCHRVLVLRDHHVVGMLAGDQITEGAIMSTIAEPANSTGAA
jgi:monosaccharide-transporting ATPase